MEGAMENGTVKAVEEFDVRTAASEQLDQPATSEAAAYDLNEAADTSASPEKNMEKSGDIIKPPTKKETTYTRKGKLRGKARVVFEEPAASPEAQGEHGDAVIAVKDGTSVDGANDANPEGDSSKGSGIKPKRKRGRPVGSLSGSGEANEVQASIGATRPESRIRKRAVYVSAMSILKPKLRKRKSATGASSSTEGNQVRKRQAKDDYPSRNGEEESTAPPSEEIFSLESADGMTLSSWVPEADRRAEDPARSGETPAPFAKTSPVWEAIDSLEIFQRMPQNPHFQPLFSSVEIVREGLAIAATVTFSVLVENISKFILDDPASLLKDYLETLSDLETHGFRVAPIRERLNSLLSIKTSYDEAQALSRELIKEKEALSKVDEEIQAIDEQIRRLGEERSAAEEEKAAKEEEIRALQVRFDEVRDFVDGARAEFERVANAPW